MYIYLILALFFSFSLSGKALAEPGAGYRAICPEPAPAGQARCTALIQSSPSNLSPTGLSPAAVKAIYKFPTSLTAGYSKTIALVDAYDDPNAEKDLAVFNLRYGLPACTTANGCFRKVNQAGGTKYPPVNNFWAYEISIDIEWAHAIAPGAKILLVEASSDSWADLLAAENYAKTHAQYVSNSWGDNEFAGEKSYDAYFVQPGVSFFAAAGDSGLPAVYPSASPNVISVGGTTLNFSGGVFKSETGLSSAGGGCSKYETGALAQTGFTQYAQVKCGGKRATPDVSIVAYPGLSIYDTTGIPAGQGGWWGAGGTSVGSIIWAARSAVAGVVMNSAYVYGNHLTFRDITTGNNGAPCLKGYDLCSGRGSWIGITP